VLAVAVLALALLPTSPTSAAPAAPAAGVQAMAVSVVPGAPTKSAFTLRLAVRSTKVLAAEQRVGSQIHTVGSLSESPGGGATGSFVGLSTVVAVENGRRDMRDERVRLDLRSGQIYAESIASAPRDRLPDVALIMPVIGGTDTYRGARGTVTIIPAGETYIVAVDLLIVSRAEQVRIGMDPAEESRISVATPGGVRWTVFRTAAVRGGGSFTSVSTSTVRAATGLRMETEATVVTARGTIQLRGSTVEVRGTAPGRTTFVVIGGTGVWTGMRGEATLIPVETGSRLDLTLVKVVGGKAEQLEWVESGTQATSVTGAGTAMLGGVGSLTGRAGASRIKGDLVIYMRTAGTAELTAVEHNLPGGTLLVAGVTATSGDPVVRPIIGGTGEYAGAIGTSTMVKVRDGVYRKTVSIWR